MRFWRAELREADKTRKVENGFAELSPPAFSAMVMSLKNHETL
jgi:hypothetical protein